MRKIIGSTLVFNISTSTQFFNLFQAGKTNKAVVLLCLSFCTLLLMSSLVVCEPSLTSASVSDGISPLDYKMETDRPNYKRRVRSDGTLSFAGP